VPRFGANEDELAKAKVLLKETVTKWQAELKKMQDQCACCILHVVSLALFPMSSYQSLFTVDCFVTVTRDGRYCFADTIFCCCFPHIIVRFLVLLPCVSILTARC
jgi:hypothetical protein